jgi:uncharacterized surface protein with fasciclin (FAS1) repeats
MVGFAAFCAGSLMAGNGNELEVKDGALSANASKQTAAGVACSNGVIHIIDAVLIPHAEMK